MLIGVPTEIMDGETRVAITPETAKKLKSRPEQRHEQRHVDRFDLADLAQDRRVRVPSCAHDATVECGQPDRIDAIGAECRHDALVREPRQHRGRDLQRDGVRDAQAVDERGLDAKARTPRADLCTATMKDERGAR